MMSLTVTKIMGKGLCPCSQIFLGMAGRRLLLDCYLILQKKWRLLELKKPAWDYTHILNKNRNKISLIHCNFW